MVKEGLPIKMVSHCILDRGHLQAVSPAKESVYSCPFTRRKHKATYKNDIKADVGHVNRTDLGLANLGASTANLDLTISDEEHHACMAELLGQLASCPGDIAQLAQQALGVLTEFGSSVSSTLTSEDTWKGVGDCLCCLVGFCVEVGCQGDCEGS